MKRRFFSAILVLFLLFSVLPLRVSAQERYTHMQIGFMGNIALTEEQIAKAKNGEKYDFSHLFKKVSDQLSRVDCMVGFLGTPLAGEGALCEGDLNAPDALAFAMEEAGVDVVSTASPNSLDCGEAGMLRTLEVLDEAGIGHTGTYRSKELCEPLIREYNGISVAFFAYTAEIPEGFDEEDGMYISTLGGITPLPEEVSSQENGGLESQAQMYEEGMDEDPLSRLALPQQKYLKRVANEIEQVRDRVDFIVVLTSYGDKYREDYQSTWADTMVRAGADFVVSDTDGQVEGMEYQVMPVDANFGRRTAIFNSLGNATMNIRAENSDEGVIFVLTLGIIKGYTYLKSTQFIPVYIDEGVMTPIYHELKFCSAAQEKRQRMKEINDRLTQLLLREHDDKRLKMIYNIKPYAGNSESADVIGRYDVKLILLACGVGILLIALIPFAIRLKQMLAAIFESRGNR